MDGYKLTVKLDSRGTADIWRRVAAALAFTIDTGGPLQGEGNISALLDAVAARKVEVAELAEAFDSVCEQMMGMSRVAEEVCGMVRDMVDESDEVIERITGVVEDVVRQVCVVPDGLSRVGVDMSEELVRRMSDVIEVPELLRRRMVDACQRLAESVLSGQSAVGRSSG